MPPKSKKAKKKEILIQTKTSPERMIYALFIGLFFRFVLMESKYQTVIANHVAVSTPVSSWKRVLEGTYLLSEGINPYDGDLLHETPLAIDFYNIMWSIVGAVNFMFIFFDMGTALLLYLTTMKYTKEFQEEFKIKEKFPKDIRDNLPSKYFHIRVSECVVLVYMFNPYSLLGCVGQSPMGIHNFFLALFIFGMVSNKLIISSLALAVCASVSFYPVILIVPLSIYFINVHKSKKRAGLVTASFLFFLSLITAYNSDFGKDFSYVKNVYGCILTVPDLKPNIGLYWYFFTEMFEHFRELFIFSFQLNATILYLVPLSIRFRNRPYILTVALIFLISIFKSYPCLSDFGFVLSFLPIFIYLLTYCQQGFIISVILIMATCLAPILWHLWIYNASANANFFFGVTLAYAIAQIFLITDILFAQLKWDFSLKHGKESNLESENVLLRLE